MKNWNQFIEESVAAIREQTGGKPVLAGLSGGVDSSVAAVLTHRAVGNRLTCLFVDHGLMRKGEPEEVERVFSGQYDMRLVCVDARERFLRRLAGVTEPDKKRKIIGEEFIRVFEEESRKLDGIGFLMQGTIFIDVAESGAGGHAAIKPHHNVGGLPDKIAFEGIVEPLRTLHKQEVRELGDALGLPRHMSRRPPFPGPGLGIRVLGEVTADKLDILRDADAIFREEIEAAGVATNQYFAVHTGLPCIGIRNGAKYDGHIIALRAVASADMVEAEWVRVPYDVLARASSRITTECPGVSRVVYDVTNKPPSTVEWE